MELVRFYACAGDPLAAAMRLVAKASERAEPLVVCGEPERLAQLSRSLWQAPGFLVHAGPESDARVRARSRVRLQPQAPEGEVPLLLNLGPELDLDAVRALRLFDVFGASAAERQRARERFRLCQQRGWPTETVQVGP